MKDLYKLKRELQKQKREIRKKALGIEDQDSAMMRRYDEATKTRRAVKTELFGNRSKQIDTSIELFVQDILDEQKIEFIPQKALRWCNYDFYLVKENIAIECEGTYWHCDPREYPKGPKNDIQRKNLEKNKMKQEICQSLNIPLMRVHELDIKKDPIKTKEQILKFIEELKNIDRPVIVETNYELQQSNKKA